MHSKVVLVDGDWASVGSANLDIRSANFLDTRQIAVDEVIVTQHLIDAQEHRFAKDRILAENETGFFQILGLL